MSTIEITTTEGITQGKYTLTHGDTYECKVAIVEDEDGFVAFAMRLPGTVSQGNTAEEALANIEDALKASIGSYLSSGPVPWTDKDILVEGKVVSMKWILVDV